ncbi:MAG TPA: hypothetical protein GXX65_06230, partial [Methanosarcina sp.]|nr:hypothetical protein [Methanosarcina sp.]
MFKNRKDAGEKLANALEKYRPEKPVILAIPRGGVEVGLQVSAKLNTDFSLIIARKLPFPDNPEAGFGAIAENGSTFMFENAHYWLAGETIERINMNVLPFSAIAPKPASGLSGKGSFLAIMREKSV